MVSETGVDWKTYFVPLDSLDRSSQKLPEIRMDSPIYIYIIYIYIIYVCIYIYIDINQISTSGISSGKLIYYNFGKSQLLMGQLSINGHVQ